MAWHFHSDSSELFSFSIKSIMLTRITWSVRTRQPPINIQGNADHGPHPRLADHARPDLAIGWCHPSCLVLPLILLFFNGLG